MSWIKQIFFCMFVGVISLPTTFATILGHNAFTYIGQPGNGDGLLALGGYRLYQPATGCFLKQDSYSPFQGVKLFNGYDYAAGNPLIFEDVTGHTPIEEGLELIEMRIDEETTRKGFQNTVLALRKSGYDVTGFYSPTTFEDIPSAKQVQKRYQQIDSAIQKHGPDNIRHEEPFLDLVNRWKEELVKFPQLELEHDILDNVELRGSGHRVAFDGGKIIFLAYGSRFICPHCGLSADWHIVNEPAR